MPVDLGMLLSASPPLYAYSAFADNRVSSFSHSNDFDQGHSYDSDFPIQKKNYLNSHDFSPELGYSGFLPSFRRRTTVNSSQTNSYGIKKECLDESFVSLKSENFDQNGTFNNTQSHNCKQQKKKRVSFADDKGFELVEIRAIPQNPNTTPKWAGNFLSLLTGSAQPNPTYEKRWKLAFVSPPYSNLALKEQLDKHSVALKNVTVDEGDEDVISGVIEVKNTTFRKDVFLRVTFDRWVSHIDIPATYLGPDIPDEDDLASSISLDFFQFSACIPPSALRYEVVEFCACYKSNGQEHWDNNGGINYRLIATATGKECKCLKSASKIPTSKQETSMYAKSSYTLSVEANFNDCPEFATWNHLINERPYW